MRNHAETRTEIGYALCHLFAWVRGRELDVFERDEACESRGSWLRMERRRAVAAEAWRIANAEGVRRMNRTYLCAALDYYVGTLRPLTTEQRIAHARSGSLDMEELRKLVSSCIDRFAEEARQ